MNGNRTLLHAGGALALAVALAACGRGHGSSTAGTSSAAGHAASASAPAPAPKETNPAGDIPDSQVYVPFAPSGGLLTVKVPEGWARSRQGAATVFTDKLNTVRIETRPAATAPTVASAKAELPRLKSTIAGFSGGAATVVRRAAGPAVRITYRVQSAPNPVTGKTTQDAVELYEFWKGGNELVLTLSGPVGADNVDPWKTITDSVRWRR